MKKLLVGIIIALVICTALGVVAKVATPDTISDVFKTYTVEGDVSNGVLGDISKLKAGSSVTVELSAEEGYALPETVTVTGASYEYDQAAGTLTLSNPTDNVEIEVVCVPIIWDITSSITNGSASGDTTIATGGTASVTLSAAAGYYLNYEILVTGASYTYNSTTGVVSLSSPTGNVAIYSACLPSAHAVNVSISNGDADGATIVNGELVDTPRLYTDGALDVTLSANTGYSLPSAITVTGATYSYNDSTGVVALSAPTGAVYITAVCTANTYAITTSVINATASGATTIATGGTASVTLTAASGYTLPATVTVTNATLDSYTGGVVTISNPTGDVTISGACTANTYAITTSVTNATASGATTISTGGTVSVTLTAASGYTLPATVTVTNATLDSYTGGVVTISNPTGNVTISGACDQIQQQSQGYTLTVTGDVEEMSGGCDLYFYINNDSTHVYYTHIGGGQRTEYIAMIAENNLVVSEQTLPVSFSDVYEIHLFCDDYGDGYFLIDGNTIYGYSLSSDYSDGYVVSITQDTTLYILMGID